jgi:hypothetical protein
VGKGASNAEARQSLETAATSTFFPLRGFVPLRLARLRAPKKKKKDQG